VAGRYRMNTRRKLAIATWRASSDPSIYGKVTVNAEPALEYLERLRRETGERVTITHLVARAAALTLADMPTLNGRIAFGRYRPHDTVDISFLVALDDGMDLGKAKIERADQKSVTGIARELRERAERLRSGNDTGFEKSKPLLRLLPTWLIRPTVWTTGWLTGSVGVGVKALGLEPYPFGSCIVTSVGMFGLDEGYAPPTPFARVPLYVLVGAVRPCPAVVDGRIVAQQQVTVTATIDHRFFDGYQGGTLARMIRDVFADPAAFDGPGPDLGPAAHAGPVGRLPDGSRRRA
jgi:pyruvate/2-oxoglutarate dehydrogenase complex dihydrolipoamide acyltransferase (E2) component